MTYTAPERHILVDAEGGEIPHHLAKLFSTRPEYQRLVNELRTIKRRALELTHTNPVLRPHEATIRQHTDKLISVLEASVCHAVHPDCEGAGCDGCRGTGFTTSSGELPRRPNE